MPASCIEELMFHVKHCLKKIPKKPQSGPAFSSFSATLYRLALAPEMARATGAGSSLFLCERKRDRLYRRTW